MKDFSSITRLDTSTPGYFAGKPKNATSETSKDGTVINDIYLNDPFQFFVKCVKDSGITPNGDFDNADSIYQLFTAVQKAILGDSGWLDDGIVLGSGVTIRSFKYRKLNGFIHLDGQVVCANFISKNTTILTLPEGFRVSNTSVIHPEYSSSQGVWTQTGAYLQQNGGIALFTDIAAGKGVLFNVFAKL